MASYQKYVFEIVIIKNLKYLFEKNYLNKIK